MQLVASYKELLKKFTLFLGLILIFPVTASATSISYGVSNISGNTWQYDYTITNDTLSVHIEEFSIYYTLGLYENLSIISSPAGWDSIAIQPDHFLPDDGFFDSLFLVSSLAQGSSLGGFSVGFDWLGTGTPGAQEFEIFDFNFDVIDSGVTQGVVPAPVPEPETWVLLLTGMTFLFWTKRKDWLKTGEIKGF